MKYLAYVDGTLVYTWATEDLAEAWLHAAQYMTWDRGQAHECWYEVEGAAERVRGRIAAQRPGALEEAAG